MRYPCSDCARKHIAQATILLAEAHMGYPDHLWLVVGHLAEASDELIASPKFERIARKLREERLKLQDDPEYRPVLMRYIEMITALEEAEEPESRQAYLPDSSNATDVATRIATLPDGTWPDHSGNGNHAELVREEEEMVPLKFSDMPKSGRVTALTKALQYVHERMKGKETGTILEIGTTRKTGDKSEMLDGWSTRAWAWYAKKYGGIRVIAVDIDPEALKVCAEVLKADDLYGDHIHLMCGRGDEVLAQLIADGELNDLVLLYLDGSDDPSCSLAELEAVKPALHDTTVVMMDDTTLGNDGKTFAGKGELAAPLLKQWGWRLMYCSPRKNRFEAEVIFVRN